jgi:pantoate ligase/cytidylate kinase
MIIAIDGPAASGKSTVARALAKRLGLVFLDTGAMYRAVTLAVQARGIDPRDALACGGVAAELELAFDDEGRIWIGGVAGEPAIRSAEVTRDVSQVAAHPAVRAAIVPRQRALAGCARRGVVAEGRDTTTVVFPRADHKFFLTATSSERARRRALEIGRPEAVAEIHAELEARDRHDATRADSPLMRASDALEIASDGASPAALVERMVAWIDSVERSRSPWPQPSPSGPREVDS